MLQVSQYAPNLLIFSRPVLQLVFAHYFGWFRP